MSEITSLVTAEAVKEVLRSEEVRIEPPRVSWRVFYL